MERKIVSGIMLTLLLIAMLTFAFNIQPVKASVTIYIRADGSIDPPFAPISSVDNVTYTFTSNITSDVDGIVVERDNIVVDGAGYVVQGPGNGTGIDLYYRSNVTVKNMKIKAFEDGIGLAYSSNNTICGNNITNNYRGISLIASSNNTISINNMTNNWNAVYLVDSYNNSISGNTITANDARGILMVNGMGLAYSINNIISGNIITNNGEGIAFYFGVNNNTISGNTISAHTYFGIYFRDSHNNTICGNDITNNGQCGVGIAWSSDFNVVTENNITNNEVGIIIDSPPLNSKIYHNNFINNTRQAWPLGPSQSIWDDGYPSGGNYWSNYTGVDLYSGPYQNETGSDGIGDEPHVINELNVDHYPLVKYNLTITATVGGTTDPALGTYLYDPGSTVEVTAFPNTGYAFDHWELDGSWNYSNPIIVTMDSAHTLHAVFIYNATIRAHCHTEGVDVSVSITMDGSPTGYNTPHAFTGLNGTHTFTVPNTDMYGHLFKQWSTGETSTTITVNANGTYTAYYQAKYNLTITKTTGGTTNPSPGTYTYWDGTSVSVTALSDVCYRFDHWELDGDDVGLANPYSVLMDNNHTLHAVFAVGIHDIAVTNVKASKLVVGQGYCVDITVTVENQGDCLETFNVTACYDTTIIETRNVTNLPPSEETTITFTWNTTDVPYGNYTITANATVVLDEIETADNSRIDGWVEVRLWGDVNNNGKIDFGDFGKIKLIYSEAWPYTCPPYDVNRPETYYPLMPDINGDGKVSFADVGKMKLIYSGYLP